MEGAQGVSPREGRSTRRPWARFAWITAGVLLAVLTGLWWAASYLLPVRVAEALYQRSQKPLPVTGSPRDLGLAYEDAAFPSAGGVTVRGWWLPAPSGKPRGTVLLAHGIFNNRVQMLSRAGFLHRAGYQVLLMDLRGEGESDKAPLTVGVEESRDFLAAEDYLRATRRLKEPLVFFGLSLGAIAALRAGVEEPRAVLILDSPVPNARSYVSRRTLAGRFTALPGFMTRLFEAYNRLAGTSLTEQDLDLIPVARRLKDRRVLYFAGEKDDLAPARDVRRVFLYTDTRAKQIFITPALKHAETYQAAPALYERTVLDFLAAPRSAAGKP